MHLFQIQDTLPRSILFFPDKMIEAVLLFGCIKISKFDQSLKGFLFPFSRFLSLFKKVINFILVSDTSTWKKWCATMRLTLWIGIKFYFQMENNRQLILFFFFFFFVWTNFFSTFSYFEKNNVNLSLFPVFFHLDLKKKVSDFIKKLSK